MMQQDSFLKSPTIFEVDVDVDDDAVGAAVAVVVAVDVDVAVVDDVRRFVEAAFSPLAAVFGV